MNTALVILATAVSTTAIYAVLIFVLKEWFTTRLRESIGDEYKRALEEFKDRLDWDSKKKEQAIQVAKIFSLWMRHHYYPKEDIKNDRYHLQFEYWQLAMWLDAPILKIVNQALTNTGENKGLTHKEAMVAVRKLLWGKDDPILAGELVHWDAILPNDPPGMH